MVLLTLDSFKSTSPDEIERLSLQQQATLDLPVADVGRYA